MEDFFLLFLITYGNYRILLKRTFSDRIFFYDQKLVTRNEQRTSVSSTMSTEILSVVK